MFKPKEMADIIIFKKSVCDNKRKNIRDDPRRSTGESFQMRFLENWKKPAEK